MAMDSSDQIRIHVNGSELLLKPGTTVSDLLQQLKITHPAVAVEIDETICPRDQMDQTILSCGQQVEVVSLVGGG